MTRLPDKPSELIRVALKDLEACEQDPRYRVDMSLWHFPGDKCAVCLAGAVMAQTLHADPNEYLTPSYMSRDYPEDPTLSAKLNALNAFREGRYSHALSMLGIGDEDFSCGLDNEAPLVCSDEYDPIGDMDVASMKVRMWRIIEILEELGQ